MSELGSRSRKPLPLRIPPRPSPSPADGAKPSVAAACFNLISLVRRSLLSSRMTRQRRILIGVCVFALVVCAVAFLSRPRFFSRSAAFSASPSSPAAPQAKIYMYDLPRKFTYGVVEKYLAARGSAAEVRAGDDAFVKYPGHQHSAEWWLFTDLLRRDRPGTSPVIRVGDPEDADLFYVPFFSSLSLVVNPIRPPGEGDAASAPPIYSDEAMQEELMQWLEEQEHWKRNGGRDHVFICQDPNALYKAIDRAKKGVLLVSDFGRLKEEQASLVKDVILPYSHRINPFKGDIGVEGRNCLLFFMGNRYRKEGGRVRDALFQVLEGEEDVVIKHGTQSRESRRMATQGMHSSKFCLHPAGDTPSACRLFDAIVSLCVPVIVSDEIELPFEDALDYRKFAIFVDSKSAVEPGYLMKQLREIKTETILEYQRELKSARRYFDYEDPNGTVHEIWRQVSSKLPLIKLMINRDKRLVPRSPGLEKSCIVSG